MLVEERSRQHSTHFLVKVSLMEACRQVRVS